MVIFDTKKYLHFDNKIGYKNVKDYVEDSKKIERHSFFPLIKFDIVSEKYYLNGKTEREDNRPVKDKIRKIMYASHIDGYIYKYYGVMLNEAYNNWTTKNNIDDCVIAYRNNKSGKSTINFAAEVIKTIDDFKDCYIMVGDYKGFFDNLDHQYLKYRIKDVLETNELPKDWYKVFKSITKYSYIEKYKINDILGTDKNIKKSIIERNKSFKYFESNQAFHEFKNTNDVVCPNEEKFGIPQGTAISAVCANVYMIQVDKQIEEIVRGFSGIYRRYSDDFIIVIPKKVLDRQLESEEFVRIIDEIKIFITESKLSLQTDKTKLFHYKDRTIFVFDNNDKTRIDYLGFVFDGQNVFMRQKSIYKYYRKAYKAIDNAKKKSIRKDDGRFPYKRKIYELYTDLGIYRQPYGNFITYAKKAQKIFDETCSTNNLMMQQIKNRKKKIRGRMKLEKKIKTE